MKASCAVALEGGMHTLAADLSRFPHLVGTAFA